MKVIYQTGIKKFEFKDEVKPVISEDEVLFRVKTVGICGSDIHYWNEGKIGKQIVKYPFILGHECAGIVEEVGSMVTGIKKGIKAAFEPALPCFKCDLCRKGRYNICPSVKFLGSPPDNGAYREYLVGKMHQILPLPENISIEEGALLEPLSVGTYSVKYSGFQFADSAIVIGAGPIGLSTLSVLKAAGAVKTSLVEKLPYRLEFAKKLNLDAYINADKENVLEKVSEITENRGFDYVFEASGSHEGFSLAIEMAKIGGTVVYIGIFDGDYVSLPMQAARVKELTLKPIRREAFGFKPALTLVEKRMVKINNWITHKYPPEKIQEAFENVCAYKDGVIKAVINF